MPFGTSNAQNLPCFPLGFSPEYRSYLDRVKARLSQLECEVFVHGILHFGKAIREASQIENHYERVTALARLAKQVGAVNENAIRECDIPLGVLDGADLASGTAAEFGFAVGIGLRCYSLRTDSVPE